MAGYKGRIKITSTDIYRNSRKDKLPASFDDFHTPITEYEFYIGNFEDIVENLEDWEALYLNNDKEQKHPIYRKYNSNIPILIIKGEQATSTIDLKNNKLTPFLFVDDTFNIDENNKGVIGYGFNYEYNYTNYEMPVREDKENCDAADRFNLLGYKKDDNNYYIKYYGLDTFGSSVWRIKSICDKIFKNGNVLPIKGIYNKENDSVLLPNVIKTTTGLDNYYGLYNDKLENKLKINNFYKNMQSIDKKIGNALSYSGGSISYNGANTGSFIIKDKDNNDYELGIPIPLTNSGKSNFSITGNAQSNYYSKIIPFILKDKNGEYWLFYFGNLPSLENRGYPLNVPQSNFNIYLTKFKDLPSGYTRIWDMSKHFDNLSDIDLLLDDIFKPVKEGGGGSDEDYNDGGADIVGPGDPYGEISNVGEIIGGNTDLTEIIQTDNASPNTSYTSFGNSTGYFGSYSLTNNDLKNYTDTLKLLYEKSTTPIIGVATSTIADRMNNAITGMIMIPKVIPEKYKQNRVFALGNCGVKNPNASWTTYALGGNGAYANADLIMNSIIEWPVQLNPIYHYYDNYLDFAPYSTASLYIPYIGTQVLPINIIQSTKDKIVDLKLSFRLNCTNGDLICILMVDGVPMTHWNGNCARNIKVSVNDDSQAIREGVNGILSMVSMNLGQTGMYSTSMSAGQVNDGNANIIDSHTRSSTSSGSLSISGVPSVPSAITSSQHLIGSACSTGELGWIDSQNIYLTVERPQWWRPNDYGDLIGYPTKKIARLGSIKGFAKVIQCHVRCSGTTSEKEELMGKLAEGVIF